MSNRQVCRLFGLPSELRREIYGFVFAPVDKEIILEESGGTSLINESGLALHAQVLRTNKLFFREAKEQFWDSLTLILRCSIYGSATTLIWSPRTFKPSSAAFRKINLQISESCVGTVTGEVRSIELAKSVATYLDDTGLRNLKTIDVQVMICLRPPHDSLDLSADARTRKAADWSRGLARALSALINLPKVVEHPLSPTCRSRCQFLGWFFFDCSVTIAHRNFVVEKDVSLPPSIGGLLLLTSPRIELSRIIQSRSKKISRETISEDTMKL